MSDFDGLCRIEITKKERDAVIDHYHKVSNRLKECADRIDSGEFKIVTHKKFLFFKWESVSFDKTACEQEFDDIFGSSYALLFAWDDEQGFTPYSSHRFDLLKDLVRLLKTKGDIFLAPHQCAMARTILNDCEQF